MSNLAGKILTILEIMQCFQALDSISVTNSWWRFSLYPDLCVQTVRRALSRLMSTFEKELRTLTETGIHICWTFELLTKHLISHKHAAVFFCFYRADQDATV